MKSKSTKRKPGLIRLLFLRLTVPILKAFALVCSDLAEISINAGEKALRLIDRLDDTGPEPPAPRYRTTITTDASERVVM